MRLLRMSAAFGRFEVTTLAWPGRPLDTAEQRPGRHVVAPMVSASATTPRAFRVLLLLGVVVTLALCDLAWTYFQSLRGNFLELNTLAAAALGQGPGVMAAYKLLLLALGAGVLYRLRKHWQAEAALWFLAAFHVGLVAWWLAYLDAVETCLHDPAVVAAVVPY
ncbi:MAG: DUF5658 family protein [Planctomycetota bacterium]